ncbi:MAG TPA: AMP-binding protein [Thermoanaerobaculaceae bacterium]|nr:AMP-binding protein [Thermoanaerobaculaceae bacterium]
MTAREEFLGARDFLFRHRTQYEAAVAGFRWPKLTAFNWALDYFDAFAAGNEATALWLVDDQGGETRLSFAELAERSSRVASFLRDLGVARGDRILVMLDNVVPLWETVLAAMKLGAVVIPATTLLAADDVTDRLERGEVRHLVVDAGQCAKFAGRDPKLTRVAVGEGAPAGWHRFEDAYRAPVAFAPDAATKATDPFLLYFTSGTTSKPKLVLHSHQSYPVGHLSTMYWIGLQPGDVHLNISSPGWAKHAWSSFFAPWNAGATVLVHRAARFSAKATLKVLEERGVTTLCAPPTVWRLLIQEDLAGVKVRLREVVGAGEPLNPEVIAQVERAWGLVIRDGYGQTETTAMVGNSPGQKVKPGSMGRPLPGYLVALLDPDAKEADEGEIAVALGDARPLGLMDGYLDDPVKSRQAMSGAFYRTGDIARRDEDGYLWYVGRADDVFKSSDYRISPFELESVLIEHPAVAEAAVVPSPDPVRFTVPKAYVVLRAGHAPDRDTARAIFRFVRERLAPFKRVRRLEFADLPKTISGKIRRVELRKHAAAGGKPGAEFREEDFPELK